MARVEFPPPADLTMDSQGNVLSGRSVTAKLAGTATNVTHYSALTGGTSTTGGLFTYTDGTIVDGSNNRRYVDSGISMDITISGRSRQVEAVSASVVTDVGQRGFNVRSAPYSAVGNGSTDDTAAIQAAINAASAAGGGVVWMPIGSYKLTSALTLASNVILEGSGRGTVLDLSAAIGTATAITATGSLATALPLSINAAEGDSSVTLSATTGLAVDDWVLLASTATVGSTSQPKGEFCRILSIVGSVVTFHDPVCDSYTTATTAGVQKATFVSNIALRNFRIYGPADNTLTITGANLNFCENVHVENIHCERTHYAGLPIWNSVAVRVIGSHFKDNALAGFGYGVTVGWACQDFTIVGCTGHRSRHLVTIGGGTTYKGIPRRVLVEGCTASQAVDAGFDCHPAGEDIVFNGNAVFGSTLDGIVFQGTRGIVSNNVIRGCARHSIFVQPLTLKNHQVTVTGNSVLRSGDRGILVSTNVTYPNFSGIQIVGNLVDTTGSRGIEVGTATAVTGLVVANNIVRSPTGFGIIVTLANNVTCTGNVVEISAASGIGIRFAATVTDGVLSNNNIKSASATSTSALSVLTGTGLVIAGNRATGTAIGVLVDSASSACTITGNDMTGCTTPYSLSTGAGHVVRDNAPGQNATTASATTTTLPRTGELHTISGTTAITSVTADTIGRVVTLLFSGALTFTDGSNLKLNGNFVTTADDTITLVSDGTNWVEIARSAN